jgi:hypothetical protein
MTTMNKRPRVRAIRLNSLEKEVGVTKVTLRNIHRIIHKGYYPVMICHDTDFDNAMWLTKFYFRKSNSNTIYYFLASGISSGYWGEGSRGFHEILTKYCNLFDSKTNQRIVQKMKGKHRYLFLLDENFNELINVNINDINIKEFTLGSRKIKLENKTPRVIKSWNKELAGLWFS